MIENEQDLMKIEEAQVNELNIYENLPEPVIANKWKDQDFINPSRFRAKGWVPKYQHNPNNKWIKPDINNTTSNVWTPNSKVNIQSKHRVWTANQQQDPNSEVAKNQKMAYQSKHRVWTPKQQQDPISEVSKNQNMAYQPKHKVWTSNQQQDSTRKMDIQSKQRVWTPIQQQHLNMNVDKNQMMETQSKRRVLTPNQQMNTQSKHKVLTPNQQQDPNTKVDRYQKMDTQSKRKLQVSTPNNETNEREQPNKRQKLTKQDYTSDGQSATERTTSSCSSFDDYMDFSTSPSSIVEYISPFE
ncbi:unnamed protein product [Diamesa tonsa]